jgi:chromosome segregation ATPase
MTRADKARRLSILEHKCEKLGNDVVQLRDKVNTLSGQKGEACAIKSQVDQLKSRHQETSTRFTNKHSLPTVLKSWEQHKSSALAESLRAKDTILQAESRAALASLRGQLEEKEAQLSACKEALQRAVLEGAGLDKELIRMNAEKDACRSDQTRLMCAGDDVERAQTAFYTASAAVGDTGGADGLRRLQSELVELTSRIRELGSSIAQDNETLQVGEV